MSQNLTQPEEIDRILRVMAGRDMAAEATIPDEVPLSGNILDAGLALHKHSTKPLQDGSQVAV